LAFSLGAAAFLSGGRCAADEPPPLALPKVVLLGDSIRLGYAPTFAKELTGRAVVVSHPANGGDSARELASLQQWAIREQPAVVHFNCGIHDVKKFKTSGQFQVPPEKYEANLRTIVERLRKETNATVLFAITTPLIDDRAAKQRTKADYELLDASAQQYNQIALKVMNELHVPVNDLRSALGGPDDWSQLMRDDGVHFTPEGSEKLGQAVAKFVSQHLPANPAKTK
jgi:lysophospholipase L1-like esterase